MLQGAVVFAAPRRASSRLPIDDFDAKGDNRTHLLQVLVYVTDVGDAATLNEPRDAWVPAGHPPVRAVRPVWHTIQS